MNGRLEIYGQSISVYTLDIHPGAENRFDHDELMKVLNRIQRHANEREKKEF